MKGTHLGEFEELVLLTCALLINSAYSVTIGAEIEEQTGRTITLSTVHTALYRLEKKGYLESYMGGTTGERGGRRKRLYRITASGFEVLNQAKDMRNRMWDMMPDYKF
ncbi:PadR family transcriptional regulator [Roseivirga misakiensis]|uniref:PadR family transcriptional regulator n=1 Tax=Roseivirga misakiensis TaxID=1563681 RepID=A0A1E5T4E4_9BACT|nr:helix-turn-helix transcriptional regulator [Roseivirga misakiensis]OEK06263.1 PadR family transcriptional regulator [Roseivirga misakiensis]